MCAGWDEPPTRCAVSCCMRRGSSSFTAPLSARLAKGCCASPSPREELSWSKACNASAKVSCAFEPLMTCAALSLDREYRVESTFLLPGVVLAVYIGIALTMRLRPSHVVSLDNYKLIKPGMAKQDVDEIFAGTSPKGEATEDGFRVWTWQEHGNTV